MHSFFVAPDNFDVVVVSGQDAIRFLQGQLTCDVANVEDGGFCFGAACNNKGRVVAAFTLIRWQESCYLCMIAGLGSAFLSAMKKYLPFYKCSMQLSDSKLYALAGECALKGFAPESVSADAIVSTKVRATAGGWLCLLNPARPRALLWDEQSAQQIQAAFPLCPEGTLEQWEALGMLDGHYPFRATDSEQFTPQELHFDRNGYVSFSKGCYTGQEIVARMHYRGKLKKQLYLLSRDHTRTLGPETAFTVHDEAGSDLGRSLVSRKLGQHLLTLIPLPVEAADRAQHLFTQDGTVVHHSPFSPP